MFVPKFSEQPGSATPTAGNPAIPTAQAVLDMLKTAPQPVSKNPLAEAFMVSPEALSAAEASRISLANPGVSVVGGDTGATSSPPQPVERQPAVSQPVVSQPIMPNVVSPTAAQHYDFRFIGDPRTDLASTAPGYDIGAATHYGMTLQPGDGINPMMAAALNRVNQSYNQSAIDAQKTLTDRQMLAASTNPRTHQFARQLMMNNGMGADEAWRVASTEFMAQNGMDAGLGKSYAAAQAALDAANQRGVDTTVLYGGSGWTPTQLGQSGIRATGPVTGLTARGDGKFDILTGSGQQFNGVDPVAMGLGVASGWNPQQQGQNAMQMYAQAQAAGQQAQIKQSAMQKAQDALKAAIKPTTTRPVVSGKDLMNNVNRVLGNDQRFTNMADKKYDRDTKAVNADPNNGI